MDKDLDIFEWKDGRTIVSAKTAAYFAQTFGIPLEVYKEMVRNLSQQDIRRLKVEAYDKANNTSFASVLKQMPVFIIKE